MACPSLYSTKTMRVATAQNRVCRLSVWQTPPNYRRFHDNLYQIQFSGCFLFILPFRIFEVRVLNEHERARERARERERERHRERGTTALRTPRGCDEESTYLRRTKYLQLSIYITYLIWLNQPLKALPKSPKY